MVRTATYVLSACLMLLATSSVLPFSGAAGADDREPTIQTPKPERWLPSKGSGKCHHAMGVKGKLCDGPRRVPEPYGAAANLAEDLGLGTQQTAHHLLTKAPEASWVNAIEGKKKPTLLWPVEGGSFGRGFGYVRETHKGIRHDGVDVGAAVGEQVRSINDGIVAYSDNQVSGYGNMIMVVHADASVSFYCHHRANFVFAGQQVKRGQVIGEVGVTGITRGPHLHFEWHVGGRPKDPMSRMVGRPHRAKGSDEAFADLWM